MNFIIFDIDGTLTNTKDVDDKCFIRAFEETFSIDISNEKWENVENVTDWGITEEIIKREWDRIPRSGEYQLMISNFVKNLEKEKIRDISQFQEVVGAKEFFNELLELKEFNLGIATGAWGKSAKLKLDTVGIKLEGICYSNSDYHKSREAITEHVIKQLRNKSNKEPNRIVYFGDGEWDYKTCQNLNIEFIGIDIKNDGKLKRLGAKTIFQNYVNKENILQQLKNGSS